MPKRNEYFSIKKAFFGTKYVVRMHVITALIGAGSKMSTTKLGKYKLTELKTVISQLKAQGLSPLPMIPLVELMNLKPDNRPKINLHEQANPLPIMPSDYDGDPLDSSLFADPADDENYASDVPMKPRRSGRTQAGIVKREIQKIKSDSDSSNNSNDGILDAIDNANSYE